MQILSLILLFIYTTYITASMDTLFEWNFLNYAWNSTQQMNYYLSTGKYDYRNIIPLDIDRSIDGRIFMTVLRRKGVPASIHTLVYSYDGSPPLLLPYPNWEAFEDIYACNGIHNVHRIAIDECNRLWILDTGKLEGKVPCPPKLLAYDLYSNTMIDNFTIPKKYYLDNIRQSLLVTPIVKTSGMECEETEVYIADSDGHAIITYSSKTNKFQRYTSINYMPETGHEKFHVAGEIFFLSQGITPMAMSPKRYPIDSTILSFKALSSKTVHSVDSRLLGQHSQITNSLLYRARYTLPSQASALAYSAGGTLFYALTRESAIGCVNPFRTTNPAAYRTILCDPLRLQYISAMKYIRDIYKFPIEEYLLILSNRMQKVFTGSINFEEINFRVSKVSVRELIKDTVCDEY